MRRLLMLVGIAGAAWWVLSRRGTTSPDRVTLGYVDGSSVTLEPGSPERERLLQVAAEAAGP
jgi:hypothetical protein